METKIAMMERWRREKRFDEADRFREEARTRLRREGMRRGEAREEAWRLTAEKFPPAAKKKVASATTDDPSLKRMAMRIEAVNSGARIEVSEAERRELMELAQAPGPWSVNLTETLDWVVRQAQANAAVPPSQASSVLGWLLWTLYQTAPDQFSMLLWGDYALRHGLTVRSVLWPQQTEHELRLRHQFIADLKRDEGKTTTDAKA